MVATRWVGTRPMSGVSTSSAISVPYTKRHVVCVTLMSFARARVPIERVIEREQLFFVHVQIRDQI
jgi:hypothetical protein